MLANYTSANQFNVNSKVRLAPRSGSGSGGRGKQVRAEKRQQRPLWMFRVTPSRPAAVCHHMQVVYYVSHGEYWQERPLACRQLDGQTAKQPAKQPASKPAKQSGQIANACETEQRQSIQGYSDNYKENHSRRETENRKQREKVLP